jgi:hypothetical protein
MLTAGIMWNLRYNAAEPTYKWEYVGGPPLWAGTHLDETIAAATTTYVATATPVEFTIPLVGDYYITNGARFYPWTVTQQMYAAADGCGIAAADNDAAWSDVAASTTGTTGFRVVKKTLTATGTLSQKYRHSNAGAQSNFAARTLQALPLRVG